MARNALLVIKKGVVYPMNGTATPDAREAPTKLRTRERFMKPDCKAVEPLIAWNQTGNFGIISIAVK